MSKCIHCGQSTNYDNFICDKCRETPLDNDLNEEGLEDEWSPGVENWLSGLSKVAKPKERPRDEDAEFWFPNPIMGDEIG